MDSVREFLAIIVGVLSSVGMPALVSWLKDCDWPEWKKVVLSVLSAFGLGLLTAVVDGHVDVQNVAGSTTAIFMAATVVYKTWFQSTAMNEDLEQKKVL